MEEQSKESSYTYGNSKKMMIALLYPKKKHHLHMDEKTKYYLDNVEKQIGLIEVLSTWEQSLLSIEHRYPLFWNKECEGYAHVGKKGNDWIAQVSMLSDRIQYDIARYRFSKFPNAEDVLTANLLNEIYGYFRSRKGKVSSISCLKCGENFHWIDQNGNLEDKWVSLQAEYCGCE